MRNREDIVIQQADKGGKIVIMNKEDYVNACEELLKDKEYYREENVDRNKEFAIEIKENIEEMKDLLTNKEKKFLLKILTIPVHRSFTDCQKYTKYLKRFHP